MVIPVLLRVCAISVFVGPGQVPPLARGDAAADARKWIQAAYERENVAAMRKDARGALANTAFDYTAVDSHGARYDYRTLRERLPKLLAGFQTLKASTRIEKLTLRGNQAAVLVNERLEGMIEHPRKKRLAQLVIRSRSEDVWSRFGMVWRKKKSRILSESESLDGEPYSPEP